MSSAPDDLFMSSSVPSMYVTVTSGMRGHFAVLIVDGEPWLTGTGSYRERAGAVAEARDWAMAEDIECRV